MKSVKKLTLLSLLALSLVGCGNAEKNSESAKPTEAVSETAATDDNSNASSTEEQEDYRIASTNILKTYGNVYCSFVSFMNPEANKKFKAGETVTGTIQYSGVVTQSVLDGTYVYINDTAVKPTADSSSTNGAVFSFTMPKENVKIQVVQTGNTLAEDGFEITEVTTSEHLKLWGYLPGEKYSNFEPVLEREAGYQVLSLQYKLKDEQDYRTLDSDGYSFTGNLLALDNLELEGDASLKIDEVEVGEYDIVYNNVDNIKSITKKVNKATYGDDVTISGFSTNDGFYFASVADVIGTDNIVKHTMDEITFVMPRNTVYINFNINANGTITAASDSTVSSYKVTDSEGTEIANARPGTKVYVTPTFNNELAVLTGGTTTNESVTDLKADTDNSGAACLSFTMPEDGSNVEVSFQYKQGYLVSTETENGTITVSGNQTAFFPGDKVKFTLRAADDIYQLDTKSIKIKGHDDITVTENISYDDWGSPYSDGYYFTMPDYAVTITCDFNEKSNVTVSYVENDISSMISSWSISQKLGNYTGSFTNDSHASSVKFYTTNALTVTANMNETFGALSTVAKRQYNLKLVVTNKDGTTKEYGESYRSGTQIYVSGPTLTADAVSLSFKLVENDPISITTKDETGGKATVKVQWSDSSYGTFSDYTSSDKLYAYTGSPVYLKVSVDGTPSDGKEFSVSIAYDNSTSTVSYSTYSGCYTVLGSVTITITEVAAVKKCSISYASDGAQTDYTSVEFRDSDYKRYYIGSTMDSGTQLGKISVTDYMSFTNGFHLKITGLSVTIDEDCSSSSYTNWCDETITVVDDIVITITAL